ncbi:MAG: EscN/YscN/HrcN family type III secretion system ATPase, partial [Anaerovoracaceae bacterium]
NHYPAIDVLGSVSRLMNDIAPQEQIDAAGRMRNLLSLYEANADLVNIGAYKPGSNALLDEAIGKLPQINGFLQQKVDENIPFDETTSLLEGVAG